MSERPVTVPTDARSITMDSVQYTLPEERIAQYPLAERDACKLLHYRAGRIADHTFRSLPSLIPPDALMVMNDTRVVNARLLFQRESGARIEVLCLEPAHGRPVEEAFQERGEARWKGFVGNAKRWKPDEVLRSRLDDLVIAVERAGEEVLHFSWSPATLTFAEVLDRIGHVPLPPYMHRPDEATDKQRYNTVFARHEGSVAAPTASLHFTPAVLEALDARGVRRTELTLHVGAGTFLPVKSDRIADHHMHQEQVRIPLAALEALRAQVGSGPVVAVGTTALRTLESLYWHGVDRLLGRAGPHLDVDQWRPYEATTAELPGVAEVLDRLIADLRESKEDQLVGATRLLIAPGYHVRMAEGLVTNFHQPGSTLLLLVSAFVGEDWRRIYDHALERGYRFLSFGDSSLLWRYDVDG
jgi:S-adenosylmethionine:tRNA ribosyltransferase-isomerase